MNLLKKKECSLDLKQKHTHYGHTFYDIFFFTLELFMTLIWNNLRNDMTCTDIENKSKEYEWCKQNSYASFTQ